jgi:RNA-directed DNA polymerase
MLYTKAGKTVPDREQFDMETKLNLISKRAKEDRSFKFSSLAHLLNEESLKECFWMLKADAAPGIDGVTFEEYEQDLDSNIQDLVKRMKALRYYPQPVKRVYIPKSNGKLRPLGIPALEDKIVQMGVTRILNAIYEPNFLNCSYGYRPNRSCHQALKAIDNKIMTQKVNYVIDADIRGFFDNVDHEWLMEMLQVKIADKNFLRIIKRFLLAGVMEDGELQRTNQGTPQGGLCSPILSNIYLHYALDGWIETRVKPSVEGYVELIRYCDDFVILVQFKQDAEKVFKSLAGRLNKFGLELAVEKTRLIEFGRYAETNARKRGGKPATFDFLGFTHFCDKTRNGWFKVGRKTMKERLNQCLKEMNTWLKKVRNFHEIGELWRRLKARINGHYNYFGVSGNFRQIRAYYEQVYWMVFKWLNRRSQKRSMTLKQYNDYLKCFPLPMPRIIKNIYL